MDLSMIVIPLIVLAGMSGLVCIFLAKIIAALESLFEAMIAFFVIIVGIIAMFGIAAAVIH